MTVRVVRVDRVQQFLLPPDMRDWLPAGHLAWSILDVVERLDTSKFLVGSSNEVLGRPISDPDMLLATLLYGYCGGVTSAREIARRCSTDVAFRVLSANTQPSHVTLSRFRAKHESAFGTFFLEVLGLCSEAGMVSLGEIAIDGTKMSANASIGKNRTAAHLQDKVAAILAEAARVDAEEDEFFGEDRRGDELPDTLTDPDKLSALIDKRKRDREQLEESERALIEIEKRVDTTVLDSRIAHYQQKYAEGIAEHERLEAAREQRRVERRVVARRPGTFRQDRAQRRIDQTVADRATKIRGSKLKVCLTDFDSRIMQKADGGFVQGFNLQHAVNEHQIIVAVDVTSENTDYGQLHSMIKLTQHNVATIGSTHKIGNILADAGYATENNFDCESELFQRLYVSTKKRKNYAKAVDGESNEKHGSKRRVMDLKMRTPQARDIYKHRAKIVEPVFGHIKHNRGITQFRRRGLVAVKAEAFMIATTTNLLKLFRQPQIQAC